MIFTTKEVSSELMAKKIKVSPEQVAELARNGAFSNASKDKNNRWQIPEESVSAYIRSYRSKKHQIRITVAMITFVITVLSLISISKDGLDLVTTYIYPQSANDTNNVAESETRPIIKPILTDLVFTHLNLQATPRWIMCRNRIQLANTGNVPTSITRINLEIHLTSENIEALASDSSMTLFGRNHIIIANVWGSNPPEEIEYKETTTFDDVALLQGSRLPIRIEGHSTVDVFIDIAVIFNEGVSLQPISTNYALEFPDTDTVSAPQGYCF